MACERFLFLEICGRLYSCVVVDSGVFFFFFFFLLRLTKENLEDAFSVSLLISAQCHRDSSESMHVSGGIIFFDALPLRGRQEDGNLRGKK